MRESVEVFSESAIARGRVYVGIQTSYWRLNRVQLLLTGIPLPHQLLSEVLLVQEIVNPFSQFAEQCSSQCLVTVQSFSSHSPYDVARAPVPQHPSPLAVYPISSLLPSPC